MTDSQPSPAPPRRPSLFALLFRFVSSFGVGIVVLCFLLLLTWLGTLEQKDNGLYDVQRKYFDSLWLWHEPGDILVPVPSLYAIVILLGLLAYAIVTLKRVAPTPKAVAIHFAFYFAAWLALMLAVVGLLYGVGRVASGSSGGIWGSDFVFRMAELPIRPIVLPGVYLLLGILFVNMLCGGIIRIRKDWKVLGVIIAHFSILFLIVAGWVSYHFKIEGHLQLYEGQASRAFTSYHNRAIEIAESGKTTPVLMIRESEFEDLTGKRKRAFHHPDLPFEVTLSGYHKNSQAMVAEMDPPRAEEQVVQGYYLLDLPKSTEAERNLPGVTATITEGGKETQALFWDWAGAPVTYRSGERVFTLHMRREAWELPFEVKLNRFTHEYHPGTRKPKVFESEVTKTEDGVAQNALIEMNKPLRRSGYTLFQASWGPPNWTPERRRSELYSVFAVVRNPADQWPMLACFMAAVGLGIHFLIKLYFAILRATR